MTSISLEWIVQQPKFNTVSNDYGWPIGTTYPNYSGLTIGVDLSGNSYTVYHTNGQTSGQSIVGGYDIVVFKLDASGSLQWTYQRPEFDTLNDDLFPSIVVDATGHSYIVYQTIGTASGQTNYGNSDIVVFKLDTNGQLLWITQGSLPTPLNTAGSETNPSIDLDGSNNLYLTYWTNGSSNPTIWGSYIKEIEQGSIGSINVPYGTTLWQSFTITHNHYISSYGVDVFISTAGGNTLTIALLMGTGLNGPVLYTWTGGVTRVPHNWVDVSLTTPILLIAGQTYTITVSASIGVQVYVFTPNVPAIRVVTCMPVGSGLDIIVAKIDTNGTTQWVTRDSSFNTSGSDLYPSIVVDSVGNSHVACITDGTASAQTKTGSQDIVVFKLDTNGVTQWVRQNPLFNTSLCDFHPSIDVDNQGYLYITYTTNGVASGQTQTGDWDIVVFSLDSNGNLRWTRQQPSFDTINRDYEPCLVVNANGDSFISYVNNNNVIRIFMLNNNGVLHGYTQDPILSPLSSSNIFIYNPSMTIDSNDYLYLNYSTNGVVSGGTNCGSYDMVVAKLKIGSESFTLTLSKTTQPSYYLGETITYTYTITNSGNVTLSGPFSITDSQISVIVPATPVLIPTGQIITTGTYTCTLQDAINGNIFNNAQASGYCITYDTFPVTSNLTTCTTNYQFSVCFLDWIRQQPTFNTSSGNYQPVMVLDQHGYIYVAYYTDGVVSGQNNTGSSDIVVMKFDNAGQLQWIQQQSTFNTIVQDQQPSIVIDSNNNPCLAYQTFGVASGQTNYGNSDIVVFKLDTNDGHLLWITQGLISLPFNTTGNESTPSIGIDNSDNLYVSYWTDGSGDPTVWSDGILDPDHKYKRSNGSVLIAVGQTRWQSFRASNDRYMRGFVFSPITGWYNSYANITLTLRFGEGINGQILATFTGTYAYDGYSWQYTLPSVLVTWPSRIPLISGQKYTITMTKNSGSGDLIWYYDSAYPDGNNDAGTSNSYSLSIMTDLPIGTGLEIVVIKLDNNGVTQWVKKDSSFNTTQADQNPVIVVSSTGDSYVTYFSDGQASGQVNTGYRDIIVFKLDTNGQTQWISQKPSFNTTLADTTPVIVIDSSGNSYVAYSTNGRTSGQTNTGGWDIVLFKLNPSGQTLWVKQQPCFNTINDDVTPSLDIDINGNLYVMYIDNYTRVTILQFDNDGILLRRSQEAYFNPTATASVSEPTIKVDHNFYLYGCYTTSGVVSGQINNSVSDIVVFKSHFNADQPSLLLTKSSPTPSYSVLGQVITYVYTITNNGNVAVTGPFVINDNYVTNFNITQPFGNVLANCQVMNATGTYIVTQNDLDVGSITNIATTQGNYLGNPVISPSVSYTINAIQYSQISINKTSIEPHFSYPGQIIHYSYTITNTGNLTLSGNFTITDDKVSGIVVITPPNNQLISFQTTTGSGTYTIQPADVVSSFVTNQASVHGYWNSNPISSTLVTYTLYSIPITITKNTLTLTYSFVGQVINYSYVITNNANVVTTGPFTITDDKATGIVVVQPPSNQLLYLQTTTGTSSYTIQQNDLDLGSLTNTARAHAYHNSQSIDSDPITCTITAIQTLGLAFAVYSGVITGSGMVLPGRQIQYSYQANNTGNVTLSNVLITDTLGNIINVGTLPPGLDPMTYTRNYTITQSDIDLGYVNSQANIIGYCLSQSTNNFANTSVNISQVATIHIDKSGSNYDHVGQNINYSYVVTNTGNVTLVAPFTITDDLLIVSYTPPLTLASTAYFNGTGTHTVTQTNLDNGSITNHASCSGYFGATQIQSSTSLTLYAILNPQLTISKNADHTTYLSVGEIINYSYLVTNTGNVTLIAPFTINDDLIVVSYTPPPVNLAPLGTFSGSGSHIVTQNDLDQGSIVNHATTSGYFGITQINGNTSLTIPAVQTPQLTLVKTSDHTTYLSVGEIINYSYVVTNTGNVTLVAPFTLNDDLIVVSYTQPISLAPLDTFTGSGSHVVTQNNLDQGSIVNHATTSGYFGITEINDNTSLTIPATQTPQLTLAKTADHTTYFYVGEIINYSYVVTNTGNVTLITPFTITDDHATVSYVPPAQLALLGTITGTSSYTVTQNDLNVGSITNQATSTGYFGMTQITTNKSLMIPATQTPQLMLAKIADQETFIFAGSIINYSYTLYNTGNVTIVSSPELSIVISDDLTSVSHSPCTLLNPFDTLIGDSSYTITQDDVDHGSVINHATGHGYFNGNLVTTNTSVTIPVTLFPQLSIEKTSDHSTYVVGMTITYSYVITNTGNVTLIAPFTISDDLVEVIYTEPSSLSPQSSFTGTASYLVTQNDIENHKITNHVSVTNIYKSQPHSASTILTIYADLKPGLSLEQFSYQVDTAPDIYLGSIITYTYRVLNSGNIILYNVTLVSHVVDQVTTHNMGTFQPLTSQETTDQYVVTQNDINIGHIQNMTDVTGYYQLNKSTLTKVIKNVRAQDDYVLLKEKLVVFIMYHPSIQLIKQVISIDDYVGGHAQYQLSVINNGNIILTNVVLTDPKLQLSIDLGTMSPNDSFVQTYSYTLTEEDITHQLVTNQAYVVGRDVYDNLITDMVETSTIPCVLGGTAIRLSNGQLKNVEQIERGDWIFPHHQVARLCQTMIQRSGFNVIIFEPNSLGPDQPHQRLMITPNHPIFFRNARRPAYSFIKMSGVHMETIKGGQYVYDLQFDHDGSYYANGIEIQSMSPRSNFNPLPKNLYYEPEFYSDESVWDSFDQKLDLVTSVL